MSATITPPGQRAPLVSIVVAVRNGARTLERCLDSIASQTLLDREVIVQDGGSTDATVSILERRSSELSYWCSKPDSGVYDAWNSAIDQCRGEWICFLGCDDEFAQTTSLATLAALSSSAERPDLICALAALIDDDGGFLRVVGRPWDWTEMKQHQRIAHPGMLHRADLFKRYGRFDTSFSIAGDYEFLLRLGANTRAAFVDQIIVRLGCNGMSRKRAPTTYKESWRAQARHPEIGPATATVNYGVAFMKHAARTLMRRV